MSIGHLVLYRHDLIQFALPIVPPSASIVQLHPYRLTSFKPGIFDSRISSLISKFNYFCLLRRIHPLEVHNTFSA